LIKWQRCYDSYWSFNGNVSVQIQRILTIMTFNKALWIRMLYWRDGKYTTVNIGVSTEMSEYRYSGYWQYWRSISPTELECCTLKLAKTLRFILEFEGNVSVQIQRILTILTFNKALWMRMLYWRDGKVTLIYIRDSTDMLGYRHSGYWQYWHSKRTTDLECFT
jgi:hypothetical protein